MIPTGVMERTALYPCFPTFFTPSYCTENQVLWKLFFQRPGEPRQTPRQAATGGQLQPLEASATGYSESSGDRSLHLSGTHLQAPWHTGWELMLLVRNFLKVNYFCKDHWLLRLIVFLFTVVITFGIAWLRAINILQIWNHL